MHNAVWPLFTSFSWQELRHHPWRNAAAVVAVMLGVALAFAVHVINASALDEFTRGVRSVAGQAEVQVSGQGPAALDEALYGRLARHPEVQSASPVLELSTSARLPASAAQAEGKLTVRVLGLDALQAAAITPDVLALPSSAGGRLDVFAPDAVFLNAAARAALLAPGAADPPTVQLQQGMQWKTLRVAGSVAAAGGPLLVMDVAAAQSVFGLTGQLSRIDLRLVPGVDRARFMADLQSAKDWPADAVLAEPGQSMERIDNLSRAYRVNLTVLALVALFTGGFLVFSVLALSVTRRAQPLALLGVLGLDPRQRWALILLEAASLGLVGSVLGIALGTGLAWLALQLLGGDLGGGYFSGSTPQLQWSGTHALLFGALGVVAALVGAWWPARMAAQMAPAQTLKGLGLADHSASHAGAGVALLLLGGALALMPPVAGIPLAAYLSVALVLLGGIAALPWMVGLLLNAVAPWVAQRPLALLAIERARRMRSGAAIAVSGVVASLSLAVALTVMVGSFRQSVTQWLDTVLPAALYVRGAGSAGSSAHGFFEPALVQEIAQLSGVQRVSAQRSIALTLDPGRPSVTLLVRSLPGPTAMASTRTSAGLPLVGAALQAPSGQIAIYVSEAMADLYGARMGQEFAPLGKALQAQLQPGLASAPQFFVAGIWRDYARQFGTIAMDASDFAKLSPDARVNELALWLDPEVTSQMIENRIRSLAAQDGAADLLEFGSAQAIRSRTLEIFDRSFAVTYWLQAVAIGIGLFGVAASFSAQVLARRKELGLLLHLGLTRRQVLQVLALEGAAWTTLGAIAGTVLGLAVAGILVFVVNPQSFHWTMDLAIPTGRLLALAGAVIAAGTLTAWLSGRAAVGQDAVMAVKEDW